VAQKRRSKTVECVDKMRQRISRLKHGAKMDMVRVDAVEACLEELYNEIVTIDEPVVV